MLSIKTSMLPGIALAVVALSFTGAAVAEPQSEAVSFADLDLTHDAGVTVLDRRLHLAVNRVCGGGSMVTVRTRQLISRCRAETWAQIEPQRTTAIARAGNPNRGLALGPNRATIRFAVAN